MAVCVAVALLLAALQNQRRLPNDTLLGILAHSALAVGLIVISFMQTLRVDLNSLLFGDILSVTRGDLYWVFGGGVPALVVLAFIWRPMLALTVHEDLARVEGVPVNAVRVAFVLLFAFIIAVAMKMVGVLLITSLLIIPAATARRFARNPEQMAVLAAVTGCVAVIGGLYASLRWDTPAGPSMVVAAAVLFVASQVLPGARRAL